MLLKLSFVALLPFSVRASIDTERVSSEETYLKDQILLNDARARLIEWTSLADTEVDACMCQVEEEARQVCDELIEEFLLDIVDYLIYERTGKNTPRREDLLLAVSGKTD